MDLTRAMQRLLRAAPASQIPPDLVQRPGTNAEFLARVATAALEPGFTDALVQHLRPILADTCARWVELVASNSDINAKIKVVAAFGRVLPFAAYLGEYADETLERIGEEHWYGVLGLASHGNRELHEEELRELLLGVFRLLLLDGRAFGRFVRPAELRGLFGHSSGVLRYLAIRIFCLYMHASDSAMESMIETYIADDSLRGLWEGRMIDYRFLALWEEKRLRNMNKALEEPTESDANQEISEDDISRTVQRRLITSADLHPLTCDVHGILLPRVSFPPEIAPNSAAFSLIPTPTTISNLRALATALLTPSPLLLSGLAGAGKSSLIPYLASHLNKASSLLILHLNEQSDAKMLLGMYASGPSPGSFVWQPGVLTTAVRQGRWVLIEDLDRAPAEVLALLAPLVERGELVLPGREERVRAARGFRLLATVRAMVKVGGEVWVPGGNMVGRRLWREVRVEMLPEEELGLIVGEKYPRVAQLVSAVMMAYKKVQEALSRKGVEGGARGGTIRSVSSRDLFKWARRIERVLTDREGFSEAHLDAIFLEGVDCFASALPDGPVRDEVVARVAEELHVDPARKRFLLSSRDIGVDVPGGKSSKQSVAQIGRALIRHEGLARTGATNAGLKPFARNPRTLELLEQVAVGVAMREPILLVGETGTGKTTAVQHVAELLGKRLAVFNLSQQSESSDLLGGFKPVTPRSLVTPMQDEFDQLFGSTFSARRNEKFREVLGKCLASGKWRRVCVLWREALRMVEEGMKVERGSPMAAAAEQEGGEKPAKRRKVETLPKEFPRERWEKFKDDLTVLESHLANGSEGFAFSFVEGSIVKAVRNGDWVLLDEINLAAADTLEALASLFPGDVASTPPSLLLTESGSVDRVEAHPDFRIFAAMNPATDVGKRDLPQGIRSRFTEIYVESPDRDQKSLQSIVQTYLPHSAVAINPAVVADVANLHIEIQKLSDYNMLVDGAGQKPHFSLRTLTRTLTFAREIAPLCSLRRALLEGFHMSYLTFLDKVSSGTVVPLIRQHLFGRHKNAAADLKRSLRKPDDGAEYAQEGKQWIRKGAYEVEPQQDYIITPFVRQNLDNLLRAISTRRFPILLQGPTSSGKTSMIEYLAKVSGNKFVRINNHEHTDLQEYLGSYVSGTDGKLRFQEGILVQALRQGHWIVLDELNLAPSDVLEALNRLLDDNRELLIPETQEVVRPHRDFILFATQNPAGLYGGRKVLSRAFRNRFLELHFDDIPVDELGEILHRATRIPESWSRRIVDVYRELSLLRQEDRIFEQRSFATLRDLFRWARRGSETVHELAVDGYMLLAERVRKAEERDKVREVIEAVMSRKGPTVRIDVAELYDRDKAPAIGNYEQNAKSKAVVWTRAMRRLYVLVERALRHNEPVLLVGETGCGKTTVCQMLADACRKELFVVNAHQNTETGDLIGAQRPVRNRAGVERELRAVLLECLRGVKMEMAELEESTTEQLVKAFEGLEKDVKERLSSEAREEIHRLRVKSAALFEWTDGSLVHAMKTGQFFLLDEISLADDSVLERLNSVLESQRTLLLAEKGVADSFVVALNGFQFLATMNPGGDYGKRELSPALRNRFTEIWVPALSDAEDVLEIVRETLAPFASGYAETIVAFAQWFVERFNTSAASSLSARDALAWVEFVNTCGADDPVYGVVQGAAMVFMDALGANPAALLSVAHTGIEEHRTACLARLSELLGRDVASMYFEQPEVVSLDDSVRIGRFGFGFAGQPTNDASFTFAAPTTRINAMRVLRALQIPKSVLLEGNPGVGKTTLVISLAAAIGKPLSRINLSEQTDLMDLFGSDVPVEGAAAGVFAWHDAPFLTAMKRGHWVLLDEMNLASQSVLEGLNACLDHRGEVYVAELDQTFKRHPEFRIFAAQNPHSQGGGRKGLPASFVNRFTVVYADVLGTGDLMHICRQSFPGFDEEALGVLIQFVDALDEVVVKKRRIGHDGAPWEFNVRDVLRMLQLSSSNEGLLKSLNAARAFFDTVFAHRFRSEDEQAFVRDLFNTSRGVLPDACYYHNLGPGSYQVGCALLERHNPSSAEEGVGATLRITRLPILESMMLCVQMKWPVILCGPSGSGKSALINQLSTTLNKEIITLSLNPDMDATDLVGGYEQVDPSRQAQHFLRTVRHFAREQVLDLAARGSMGHAAEQGDTLGSLLQLETLGRTASANGDVLSLIVQLLEAFKLNSPHLSALVDDGRALMQNASVTIDKARFEWVDGVIIRALEEGHWLVLDNANLCSSSVLDRLNSLLEPNGKLLINEHTTGDGQARVVIPHPDFRVFLTVDPKFGELSRAMRNRAVELYVGIEGSGAKHTTTEFPALSRESFVYRYRHFDLVSEENTVPFAFDHLARTDVEVFGRFYEQVSAGLLEFGKPALDQFSNEYQVWSRAPQEWKSKLEWYQKSISDDLNSATDFAVVQPLDPLINEHAASVVRSSTATALAAGLDNWRQIVAMENLIGRSDFSRISKRSSHMLQQLWETMRALPPTASIALWKCREIWRLLLERENTDKGTGSSKNSTLLMLCEKSERELTGNANAVEDPTGFAMSYIWRCFLTSSDGDMREDAAIKIFKYEFDTLAQYLNQARSKSSLDLSFMKTIARNPNSSCNAVRENLHLSLASRLADTSAVPLARIEDLTLELRALGKSLALGSAVLCSDQMAVLESIRRSMAETLVLLQKTDAVKYVFDYFFGVPLENGNLDVNSVADSWVRLAVGFLVLYLPRDIWDPYEECMTKRELHFRTLRRLEDLLKSLQIFETSFTANNTSMRIRMAESSILQLGDAPSLPPDVASVSRPSVSKLHVIQEPFKAVRQIIDGLQNGSASSGVLEHNVNSAVRFLMADGLLDYRDITEPVVGMLQCLRIGWTLKSRARTGMDPTGKVLNFIKDTTPLMGLSHRMEWEDEFSRPQRSIELVKKTPSLRWHLLEALSLCRAIEDHKVPTFGERHLTESIFEEFYAEWSSILKLEQAKAAENSGLYRYRGSHNDENETEEKVFADMFPSFEGSDKPDDDPASGQEMTPQALAVKVANMHRKIYLDHALPTEQVRTLLDGAFNTIGSFHIEGAAPPLSQMTISDCLPTLLLKIQQQSQLLSPAATEDNSVGHQDFYFNPNVSEARSLVALTRKVQRKFQELVQKYPEFVTISDVLVICNEILAFRHTEPVAKFLTKTEKLLLAIHEWQRVTRKEDSAADVYDNVTQVLVRWRKLELGAWARLFDAEVAKCRDEAKGWWFIAYENIVHNTGVLGQEGVDMTTFSTELLRTLSSFLASTVLGQFHERLCLLRQFQQHLAMRTVDNTAFASVVPALSNFIGFYERYEHPVAERLARERRSLEREMNDILRLASWKDTNIESLRQSAKSSHLKLFKLVRKYRDILSQPFEVVSQEGLPDVPELERQEIVFSQASYLNLESATDHSTALQALERLVQDWENLPTRFRNPQMTASIMKTKAKFNTASVDGSAYIDYFLSNIERSMTELRKATPSVLTEENHATVQHLKGQKRKLFADALKGLRQMGFKSNVGIDVLQRQESIPTVLASLPMLPNLPLMTDTGVDMDYHLAKALDIMTLVRQLSRDHSPDLSSAEVGRSISLLESILQTAIQQRHTLSEAYNNIKDLEVEMERLYNVSHSPRDQFALLTAPVISESLNTAEIKLRWIAVIARVGADIISSQSQLGDFDSSLIVDSLRGKANEFDALIGEVVSLPRLFGGLITSRHKECARKIEESIECLRLNITSWCAEHPDLACILNQIAPWIRPLRVDADAVMKTQNGDCQSLKPKAFELVDQILGSVQDIAKALTTIPTSVDDPSWLLSESRALSSTLSSLHMPHILTSLRAVLGLVESSSNDDNLRGASALLSFLWPVFDQYRTVVLTVFQKFSQVLYSTCRMSHRLSKAFSVIGKDGFCAPHEESTTGTDGQTEKLEGGTGLGEGEGAEDISKDVGDDEDLGDLAQEPITKNDDSEELEDQKDAVDMADRDMEGELGDASEKESDDGSTSGNDDEDAMDEQVGDVDDLGPSTVDEKMWDGERDETNKEKEDKKQHGMKDDERTAGKEQGGAEKDEQEEAQGEQAEGDEESDKEMEPEMMGRETERMDPFAKEEETLDLPEDLEMDEKDDRDDDSLSDPMDGDEFNNEQPADDAASPEVNEDGEVGDEPEKELLNTEGGEERVDSEPENERKLDEDHASREEEQEARVEERPTDTTGKEQATRDEPETSGLGGEQAEKDDSAQVPQAPETTIENMDETEVPQEAPATGSGGQESASAEISQKSSALQPDNDRLEPDNNANVQTTENKELGDALEEWHQRWREINQAIQKDNAEERPQNIDMVDAEFEHLQNESEKPDTQALGTADTKEAIPMGDDQGMVPPAPQDQQKDEGQTGMREDRLSEPDANADTMSDMEDHDGNVPKNVDEDQQNVLVGSPKENLSHNQTSGDQNGLTPDESVSDLEDVEKPLSEIRLDRDEDIKMDEVAESNIADPHAIWASYESRILHLSQVLTSHLRLILEPTQATKLRGDFRTGKRLNIKRIIPYIASGYKRDKIWLRRSVPSKRAYQIMLALDDSRSMSQPSTVELAFETLALVGRALTQLEAGELSVVRFGENVDIAHDFATPWGSEAGARLLPQFRFEQGKTDVKKLMSEAISQFTQARTRAQGKATELWQLMLVISDGLCDDHESIKRLVRQAQEERIMVVFIVVDAGGRPGASSTSGGDGRSARSEKVQSILDLQTAEFGKDDRGEMKLVRRKYLDTFPFRWYLIVRDVKELPGVLAQALRQWFAEVAESAG
ncbi:hypothetical protein BDY21DRAFT_53522 [Lineolata rhizophorae]|uniref:Midasin n=1 Tax=Lineolata rhizophorae TaxID=578093 RepID=A0A6A6NXR8_9PEZI|nr:hypothetical protein BDY21DRAFT_53522 [Lineolata rhizophorae]